MPYGPVHRFTLRTILSQGVITTSDVENYVRSNFPDNEESLEDIVKDINEKIRPLEQSIKISNDEATDEQVAIFLCLGFDDATKAQNFFSPCELEYFRLLIEVIMSTESRQISGILALNLVSKLKGSFTKIDSQNALDIWTRMRYLDKDGDNYVLGVRTIHEFDSYFREHMPDAIEECCLCKQTVFRGFNCPSCTLAVHTKCLDRYLEKVQKWPCCKCDFNRSQLEQLNNYERKESSRLTRTQTLEATQRIESTEDTAVPSTSQQSFEDMEATQELIPEISQRVTKKRKQPCQ